MSMDILERLSSLKNRFEELERKLSDPKTMSDMRLFAKLNREYKELKEVVDAYHKYKNIIDNIESSKEIFKKEKDEDYAPCKKRRCLMKTRYGQMSCNSISEDDGCGM